MNNFIDRQNNLIELCEKLEKIFSPSIFVFVAGSSCIMSLLCFQLSVNFEAMHFLKYGIQLSTSLLGMWFFFKNGQSLIDSSSSVADGIYESENPQIKK